jgi:uncharacterized protein (TIGR00296 family)
MVSLKDYALTEKDAVYLVKLARTTVENSFKGIKSNQPAPQAYPSLEQNMGAFVTIKTFPDKELRGCIGYPTPRVSLRTAVIENAVNAAFNDPRFPSVVEKELAHLCFEVSILTPPQKITVDSPDDYIKKIRIGRDGLIMHYGSVSGLLLPQVPVELNWNVRKFLEALCQKTGLPKNMWASPNVQIYVFHAFVYGEEKPSGRIKKFRFIQ